MPIEMVRSIENACKDGTMSPSMKASKKKMEAERGKKISCHDFAEAMTAMIENKRKSTKSAHGGEASKAVAYTTQYIAEGGVLDMYTSDEKDAFWVNVWDAGTKLNMVGRGPVEVDELAHVLAKDRWRERADDLRGHIDHDATKEIQLNIDDVKFDWAGSKLMLHMRPGITSIYDGMKDGSIKPSIEVELWDEDFDEEGKKINRYNPTGLGLMVEKRAMGQTVGPDVPGSQTAMGGDTVTDDVDTKVTEFKTTFLKQVADNPKEVVEKKDELRTALASIYEDGELPDDMKFYFNGVLAEAEEKAKKADEGKDDGNKDKDSDTGDKGEPDEKNAEIKKLTDQLTKQKTDLETMVAEGKTKKDNLDAMTKMLIEIEVKNSGYLEDEIKVREGMSLDDVKLEIKRLDVVKKRILEGQPAEKQPPWGAKPPDDKKQFDENDVITDEGYKVEKEKYIRDISGKKTPGFKEMGF